MQGSGIAFFAVAATFQSQSGKSPLPFFPDSLALPFQNSQQSAISSVIMLCTTFVNLTLTVLIFFRLLYYQRFISKTLGKAHGLPYTKVITMCVESCALIVVFSTVNIVMIITNNVRYLIPFLLFPHVCVSRCMSYKHISLHSACRSFLPSLLCTGLLWVELPAQMQPRPPIHIMKTLPIILEQIAQLFVSRTPL